MNNLINFIMLCGVLVCILILASGIGALKNQNKQIISNQNQIIILLSKDYPELTILKEEK